MADVVKISHAASDISRFLKSKSVSTAVDGGNRVTVLSVPRKTFVSDLFFEVQTALTAGSTGSVSVGLIHDTTDDVNYFMGSAEVVPEVVGFKAVPEGSRGFYFEKGGTITISLDKGNSAADFIGRIFVDSSVIY